MDRHSPEEPRIQALLMTFCAMGKLLGTVYTVGRPDGGYFEVSQRDPVK
jgi:hypothetical protein